MGNSSHIEWTDATWNPVTGCKKVSAGCLHCYAERMTARLKAMGNPKYRDGFDVVRCHHSTLNEPLRWRRPSKVFVCSMSDLFHGDVPASFIRDVFSTMAKADRHVFQVLTKRARRMSEMDLVWPDNVWAGVTVESEAYTERIAHLRHVKAATRFVSFEPLLGRIQNAQLEGIEWAIVGGESGPGARPMLADWATGLRDQCRRQGIAFFFKQWGGTHRSSAGRELDGRTWDEFPAPACGSAVVTCPVPV